MPAKEQFRHILSSFFEDDERCMICHQPMTEITDLLRIRNDQICSSCRQKLAGRLRHATVAIHDTIFHVSYCYVYHDFLSDAILRYKANGDIRLGEMFLKPWQKSLRHKLRRIKQDIVLVRMPSWKEDDERRGFNHVEELFSFLGYPIYCPFIKTKPEKQSKKTKAQRQNAKNWMVLDPAFDRSLLEGRYIILADDIMTTGNTLYRAAELLGRREMDAILLALHEFLSKKDDGKRLSG